MSNWYMLTLVGRDRPGIVAAVTGVLYEAGLNLGEASMMRLGGNFTIMLMAGGETSETALGDLLAPTARDLGLRVHVDAIEGALHQHRIPNFRVRVLGADRAGIVAQVTRALAGAGFNILELESDVAGTEQVPVYIMNIEGYAETALEALQAALEAVGEVDATVEPVETLVG
ncbi:MAG: ACT domain-containing protein [Pseudomonadota bacterium]